MADTVEKLTTGEPLTIDQLLEYLPALKEIPRAQLAIANRAPAITKPILVDRWMPQANFNHAKHQVDPTTQKPLDCNLCHQAAQSRDTSDVLMPAKASCIVCHSPQGKIVAECVTCHSYHAPTAAQTGAGSASSVKEMLLGAK